MPGGSWLDHSFARYCSGKRVLSTEPRAKIAAAQKARWAKFKKAMKRASGKPKRIVKGRLADAERGIIQADFT